MKQFIKEAEKLEKLYMKFSQNKATQQQVEKQYEIILNIIKKNEDSLNNIFKLLKQQMHYQAIQQCMKLKRMYLNTIKNIFL